MVILQEKLRLFCQKDGTAITWETREGEAARASSIALLRSSSTALMWKL